ncbi:hypothetical protein AHAS_Ahas05G0114700 [Arachis hypogaea]
MIAPWMLIGDFNDILDDTENKGGARTDIHACRRFWRWIEDCKLIDLGSVGTKFTRKGGAREGLDRVFKSEAWKKNLTIPMALKSLSDDIRQWNRDVFGHLFKEKRTLLNRIAAIQNSPSYSTNPFLDDLEKEVSSELDIILDREEVFWLQRSRHQWIVDGDQNTCFYHTKTLIRRRKNCIVKLRSKDGAWIEDQKEMKGLGSNYFNELFKEGDNHRSQF